MKNEKIFQPNNRRSSRPDNSADFHANTLISPIKNVHIYNIIPHLPQRAQGIKLNQKEVTCNPRRKKDINGQSSTIHQGRGTTHLTITNHINIKDIGKVRARKCARGREGSEVKQVAKGQKRRSGPGWRGAGAGAGSGCLAGAGAGAAPAL